MFFNDSYFADALYQDRVTSATPDLLSMARRLVPSDPLEHSHGQVGISSRWWYLPGMFKPQFKCGHCTERPTDAVKKNDSQTNGTFLAAVMRKRKEQYEAARKKSAEGGAGQDVIKSGELYRMPSIDTASAKDLAPECAFWPRYHQRSFAVTNKEGPSMLELTLEEARALQIVCLRTKVKAQRYGAAHHTNWKKIGLSTAYFKNVAVTEASMPTPRAVAALRYLLKENDHYIAFWKMQKLLLEKDGCLSISSFDLFINHAGIECAMFPVLYPETAFSDTGILKHYKDDSGDQSARIVSIGRSWTRKVCSSVRVYAEQRDLAFFLYEKQMAMKYFAAHSRAQRMGVTADVMTRDSQSSTGYWEIVRDALADLVRIMLLRCYDEANHKQLFDHVRGLRGQVWLCAFPNLFITIAPAEWTFPRPYFLEPYSHCVFAGAYLMALHMFYLVRCIWRFLANRWGCKWFIVYEYVIKTEYQGRGTPHWHIAAWVVCFTLLRFLTGNTGKRIITPFVRFLQLAFACEIDVQVGNGRLNYINGYVAKDHDAVDVGLGEYVQSSSTAPWLAAYRLLSKSTPCANFLKYTIVMYVA
jgi:hypothetical protein